MSNRAWINESDVLEDLRKVNGRTVAAHLDNYVVRGEMPPPARHEIEDEEEMQYRFGRDAGAAAGDCAPDLKGISQMLQLVDDVDDADNAEMNTIFRNTVTEEISISKLNPNVNEFVPGRGTNKLEPKVATSKQVCLKNQYIFATNGPMFIRKSDKINLVDGSSQGGHSSVKAKTSSENSLQLNKNDAKIEGSLYENGHSSANYKISSGKSLQLNNVPAKKSDPDSLDSLKEKSKSLSINDLANGKNFKETSILRKNTSTDAGDISLHKKLDITKLRPDEIAVMKEKVKSKIINSSPDDSLERRREKNVAIATLLKLCAAPAAKVEKPVKLVTPQYFQGPAIPDESDTKTEYTVEDKNTGIVNDIEEKEIEEANTSSTNTKVNQKYVDPLVEESISKVNDWFNNTGNPKPRPPVVVPIQQPIAFKKKATPSQSLKSTQNSEASIEKKESCGNFVPSSYADDLLQKYKSNAIKQVAPKEDLGTMLERQLKERDQAIKKKLLEKKNASSPNSGRSVR